jgi:predicted dehydrogenase
MSKLRLIQAGVGGFGKGWATSVVPASDDFTHAAIVDVNSAALNEVGDRNNIPPALRFTDLAVAIKTVRADALLTVTPPAVHLDHARQAFAAGLHVLTEKPLADSLDAAKEMVRLAAAAGRQLMVSQNYRFNAAPRLIRSLIESQQVGAMGHGHMDFYIPADFTGSFRETMRHVLLVDMGIHHIDLLRYITGRNVLEVFAQTFRPQWSWYQHNPGLKMLIKLEGDITFSYSGDWSGRGRNTSWNGDWRIQCAEGSIHWSHNKVNLARSSRGFNNDTAIEELAVDPLPLEGQSAVLRAFADAIRTGRPASTCGADNLQSFGAIMAAVRSAETGLPVNVQNIL